jgi:hypothetical protein
MSRSPGLALALFACLVAAACRTDSPVGPVVPFDAPFELRVGSAVVVAGSGGGLVFLRVSSDSRCPIDAVCIQGGDAVVHLKAVDGVRTDLLALHTGDTSRATAAFGSRLVTLVDLHPYPFSSQPIDPASYVATLRVTRVP